MPPCRWTLKHKTVPLRGEHINGRVTLFPPLIPLVSTAEATKKLRVGTFVLNNDFRQPVILAREAATVDLLTDGRLELGLGAGHMRSEDDEAGIRFDPASVRIERLGEAVTIIKDLLEGRTANLQGRHYRVSEHRSFPTPRQQPRPPMRIGGRGCWRPGKPISWASPGLAINAVVRKWRSLALSPRRSISGSNG